MNKAVTGDMAEELQNLYLEDDVATSLIDWFAERQNDSRETAVRRAASMTGVRYTDVVRVFRRMAELGCGRFLSGRKGHKSRMVWEFGIRSVASAAKGEGGPITRIDPRDVEDGDDWGAEDITHEFQLRSDHQIHFQLPADLSIKEAERLAAFIKTLPFE